MTVETSQISFKDLFFNNFDDFCHKLNHVSPDLENGLYLPFELVDKKRTEKINPLIQLATPKDAKDIVQIYFDIYNGTYPYKEMEDANEVKRMIESEDYEFVLFKDGSGNIMGCFTAVFDYLERRAYLRGYNVKPKYQKCFDVVKGFMGSLLGWCYSRRNQISSWYGEIRTAHASSQYFCQVSGMKNIAFLPNKDIFLNKVESIILHIGYNQNALTKERSSNRPYIIPEIQGNFNFTQERYPFLDKPKIVNPIIDLDKNKIKALKKRILRIIESDKYGYTKILFGINNTESYLECLHTPQSLNFEKIKFHTNSLEELYVLLNELKVIASSWKIQYMEALVSAYEPFHQQLFLNTGFEPRGYIPSWKYDPKDKKFKDFIMFNWYRPPLAPNLKLIDEGWELLRYLGMI